MKQKGFTLIELIIVCSILGIIFTLFITLFDNFSHSNGDGTTCVGGYKFMNNGEFKVQIINEQGVGIPCDNKPKL